jgi:hypothetical protein
MTYAKKAIDGAILNEKGFLIINKKILYPQRKQPQSISLNLKPHLLKMTKEDNIIKNIYKQLFNFPVTNVFYWHEEDYQGSIYSIFQFKTYIILVRGGFGSCSGCDFWIDLYEGRYNKYEMIRRGNEHIEKIYNSIEVYNSIDDIVFGDYCHPDFKCQFERFKETSI